MHTQENHLRILDPYSAYLQWFEGQVKDGSRTVPVFYRNVLDSSGISFAGSHTEMTWSTRRGRNTTTVEIGYMRKCIQQTGGGTSKYSFPTHFMETLADRL